MAPSADAQRNDTKQRDQDADAVALMQQPPPAFATSDPRCLQLVKRTLRLPTSQSTSAPLGREQQYEQLKTAITTFLTSGKGSSIYVSGLPGTGKTHTITRAVQECCPQDTAAAPLLLAINCMSNSDPQQLYGSIVAAYNDPASANIRASDLFPAPSTPATAQAAPAAAATPPPSSKRKRGAAAQAAPAATPTSNKKQRQAADPLGDISNSLPGTPACTPKATPSRAGLAAATSFQQLCAALQSCPTPARTPSKSARKKVRSGPRRVVLVLDEMDALLARSEKEVCELFTLPHLSGAQVLIIGISNSIDLTERTLPALRTRGCQPAFICFPAYSAPQVRSILSARMAPLPWQVFDESALDLCARHVSANTGDLRHALRACGQALDVLTDANAKAAAGAGDAAAAGSGKQRVGPREMSVAVSRLAGAKAAHSAASAVAAIRAMPVQQQLMMFVLAKLTAPPEAKPTTAASDLRPDNEFADLLPISSSAGKGGKGRARAAGPGSASKASSSSSSSSRKGFASSADLEVVYGEYCSTCRQLALKPVERPGLRGVTELLCSMGLAEMQEARVPKPARLALKASQQDVKAALGSNPLFRALLAGA